MAATTLLLHDVIGHRFRHAPSTIARRNPATLDSLLFGDLRMVAEQTCAYQRSCNWGALGPKIVIAGDNKLGTLAAAKCALSEFVNRFGATVPPRSTWCATRLTIETDETGGGHMPMLTLGEAARLTGLGKTTLARAIKAGRLSATRTDAGSYEIDPAELARVYPFPAPTEAAGGTDAATGSPVHHATPGATTDATTDALVATLREQLADMRCQRDDVRLERDRWRGMAERLALPSPRTSLWRWLRSTG
jgi:excisionase family DNA binding protein